MRAAAQRIACSVTRDDTVLIWECFGDVNVLIGDKWLSSSLQTPGYLTLEVREREASIVIDLAEEFMRIQGSERGSHFQDSIRVHEVHSLEVGDSLPVSPFARKSRSD